jgi:SHS2 domain-containing protein
MHTGYSILEHPSDLGIEAHGVTLKEAFEQAAVGLMSIIVNPMTVANREVRTISITASDNKHLLVKWLTEILYMYDGQRFVCKEFQITHLTDRELTATVKGEPLSSTHRTKLDVKAVTYHQLEVLENESGCMVRVFLDI